MDDVGNATVTLTIDSIVEKYRSVVSAATHGVRVGPPAEQEEQIEQFRADLIVQPRAEQITNYLGLFGSHERSVPLLEATYLEPPHVFWPVFLDNWCGCDGLWAQRKHMLPILRRRTAELSPIGLMNPLDRAFYEGLPDRVTVFRGCGRRRVRGLPWTTDRQIAERFARGGRFPPPPDPVVASAEIEKADLFFVSTDRKESEVILDPKLVQRLRLETASLCAL
jgi:hypothetical protein